MSEAPEEPTEELIHVDLQLTRRQADWLTTATCDFFHKMRAAAVEDRDYYSISQENLQAAYTLWRLIDQATKFEA